jgi:hypothetical protein
MARTKPAVMQGRWMAELDGDFVVFLIGARFSRWHPIQSFKDLGGRKGINHMLSYLTEHPDKGLLGYEMAGLGKIFVLYWRSFEDLERFARDSEDPHLEPWRQFWRRVGKSGRTGIWHETYLVRAGEFETVYGNMPPFGLGKATKLVTVAEGRSARERLSHRTEP